MYTNSLGLGSISTPRDGDDGSMTLILEKLRAMGERLTAVEESNTELRESNTDLWERNERLEGMMQTTMEAVIGVRDCIDCILYIICLKLFRRQDRIAINKIRNRVLLDLARDRLAIICGYKDWYGWKAAESHDTMFNSASNRLQNAGDDISKQWKAVYSRSESTALKMLIFRNSVRSRGDIAAHASAQKLIGESVLGLTGTQREDMCTIFAAVYGVEPIIDAVAA